ncbi:MAG: hypothetical protein COX65_10000 [Elusimicrobia bacterium CG_4_10_14_0_2_um_filter_56_8]|nr:MAG: hypothetical protein AUJ51_13280 [Elusimicrobia bacterium CG1_02_56_21]PJA11622.1 MAG: hypothetical protein COX65_10000 [Elusimicrobia bacterium CG_4_10_14_0_2_um_filter_56_8]
MSALNLVLKDTDAILEIDQPGSKVNVLNAETMAELSAILDELEKKAGAGLKTLVITSKKKGIFIAGADIKEIEVIDSSERAAGLAREGQEIFNRLAALDLVTVAAINGVCMGGGFELALACRHRVASFSDKVKIGLPEVNLGIMPGWGGTQRLPRLAGLMRALNMIMSSQIISGKDALKAGVVDRLFPEDALVEGAAEYAGQLAAGTAGEKRKPKRGLFQVFLEDTLPGRSLMFAQAEKNAYKKTKGFYPAPLKALEVIKGTYGGPLEEGLLAERLGFGELAVTEVSRNLIKVFFLSEKFKKYPWVEKGTETARIKKCAVAGAGIMGGGIAQLISSRDIPVRLKDINYDALKQALKTAAGIFKSALKRRKLDKYQIEYKMGLISPTITYQGFKNSDLVVEAVVEDLGIKRKVFEELEKNTRPDTVIVSNTSSLTIEKIGENAANKERIAGLHFFNPVNRMPLVEVIRTEHTSAKTLATVVDFSRRLGKTVIVVKDVPGFLVNRILVSYLNEAAFLIEEGMAMDKIDSIACAFGMPMGPIELIDEVGVDVGCKVAKILETAYGERMRVSAVLDGIKKKGLLGKKAKKGFYLYSGSGKTPNPEIYGLAGIPAKKHISDETALKRLIYGMINESARCLEENVAESPQVVDIGMIMGAGFPPFRGGVWRYAESVGLASIVEDLRALEKEFGSARFAPSAYLIKAAEEQGKPV